MSTMYDDLSRPPLNRADLSRALVTAGSRWSEVVVVDATPSTNAVLSRRARDSDADGVVLIAEHQTAGRGRRDRSWSAPARAGITMSVLVRPVDVLVTGWPWISLIAGLAVAASVRGLTEVPAGLKWPNDVVVDDRKLAGVLVERVEGAAGAAAVIGMGLNVTTLRDELPVPEATSLLLEGAVMTDRTTLVKAVLRRLESLLTGFELTGGRPDPELRAAYLGACTTLGRRVRVELPGGRSLEGDAVGLDESGRLLVDDESGRHVLGAGDVVHVRRSA